MDEKKKLSLSMGILFLFVIVFFGSIIISEKSSELMLPKMDEKFTQYIENEYKEIYSTLTIDKAIYNKVKKQYEVKVKSLKNKHLYFIVSYKNKKYSTTYKNDFIYGESLLNYYQEKLKSMVKEKKKYKNISIEFTKTLDQYSHEVSQSLLTNDQINSLSIYDFSCDLSVLVFTSSEIAKEITSLYQYIKDCELNPKYLNLVITDKNDISHAILVKNLDPNLINQQLPSIIQDILNKDNNVEDKYGITYQYMN